MEIKNEEYIKWPRKIKTNPLWRNKNKYCECFQLKEHIADLIKRGYLRKFVADRPRLASPDRGYADNRLTIGHIQTIHGGFGSGGCSNSSRKKHAQEVKGQEEEKVYNLFAPMTEVVLSITFINKDLRGLHLPHDDALVISSNIANFNIQKILIDNGSSTDILFILVFDIPILYTPGQIWERINTPSRVG